MAVAGLEQVGVGRVGRLRAQRVVALAAGQRARALQPVLAGAAVEPVAAVAALEAVVAVAAAQRVVARAAVEPVAAFPAGQRIGAIAARAGDGDGAQHRPVPDAAVGEDDPLDLRRRVDEPVAEGDRLAAGQHEGEVAVAPAQRHRVGADAGAELQRVELRAAVGRRARAQLADAVLAVAQAEQVGVGVAVVARPDLVVAGAAGHRAAADQQVVARAAEQGVLAGGVGDEVVARAGVDAVVAAAAIEKVIAGSAVPLGAHDRISPGVWRGTGRAPVLSENSDRAFCRAPAGRDSPGQGDGSLSEPAV